MLRISLESAYCTQMSDSDPLGLLFELSDAHGKGGRHTCTEQYAPPSLKGGINITWSHYYILYSVWWQKRKQLFSRLY